MVPDLDVVPAGRKGERGGKPKLGPLRRKVNAITEKMKIRTRDWSRREEF